MKSDRYVTAGIAAVLAFLLALGSVGCMISAFALPFRNYPAVVLAWGISAVFCGVAFSWKRGVLPALGLAMVLAGYLWRRGEFAEQLLQLVYRITYVYNRAYGLGVLKLVDTPWDAGFADWPMGVLGICLSAATAWTVCRGKSVVYVLCLALLPLLSCLVVTDTVPSAGSLFLLLFVTVLLLLTAWVRKDDSHQGNRLTLLAAAPTALALSALLLAVPRENYVNQSAKLRDRLLSWAQDLSEMRESGVREAAAGLQSGEPDGIDLASMGQQAESAAPVMDVCADVGGTLYLRGQDYDVYDGTSWTASAHRVEDFSWEGISLGSVSIETRNRLEQLYLPYYPKDVRSLVGGKLDNLRLSTRYTFARTGLPDNWRELAAAGGESGADAADASYLALPDGTRAGAEALLEEVLQDASAVTEKAEAISKFVRSSARYDRNTARMPDGQEDFALWFLKESETGYCVHFATASVVLLRAAGIEARYVSGYMVRLQAGETTAVTGENAHAWAEYYEPSLGVWLVLEATPSSQSEAPETTGQEQAADPAAETRHYAAEPSDMGAADRAEAESQPEETAPRTGGLAALTGFVKCLPLVAAAAVCAEGQRRLRRRLRRRRWENGTPNARALACWQEAELLAKLLRQAPPQDLEELAQKAKFSRHTLSPEELAQYERFRRAARKSLRQKPWYLRAVYRYFYAI